MKEVLVLANSHIKDRKLTERLVLLSDGFEYILIYQSMFEPAHNMEIIDRELVSNFKTIQDLYKWIDKIIDRPRS